MMKYWINLILKSRNNVTSVEVLIKAIQRLWNMGYFIANTSMSITSFRKSPQFINLTLYSYFNEFGD